ADFDGDQMAVHLPLSSEAQAEARVLMLSANNILSPADGRPMTVPSQDMIIGGYYLTEMRGNPEDADLPVYKHFHEIERAVALNQVQLHQPIIWRHAKLTGEDGEFIPTTPGRVLFNEALPEDFPFVNTAVKKGDMGDVVGDLSDGWPTNEVAAALDRIKDLSYEYATKSGLTISIDDVRTPPDKAEILERYEGEAERVENQFRRGIITDGERRQKEVEIWTSATEEVRASLERELKSVMFNPIDMMVGSGA
ncbi:MAG TPA: DNA-directed RNA polymerase subunit beta', partial [Acidimicrobiaceae bacterium]|nr:DNA-directed RNA polymerase subunit beta' [Acidimicrobiaceae bacterium]